MIRLLCLLLLLPLVGCMHRNYVHPDTAQETMSQLNQKIAGHRGVARLKSGESLWGTDFKVNADSSLWKNLHSNEIGAIPNRHIDYLIIQDRHQGIKEGLFCGLLVGGSIGAILGTLIWATMPEPLADCQDCPPNHDGKEPMWKFVTTGAASGAAIGAGIGLIIGGSGGSLIRIDFEPETAIR